MEVKLEMSISDLLDSLKEGYDQEADVLEAHSLLVEATQRCQNNVAKLLEIKDKGVFDTIEPEIKSTFLSWASLIQTFLSGIENDPNILSASEWVQGE